MNKSQVSVFSIGPKPIVQRRLHNWIQKTTVGVLLSLGAFSVNAHDDRSVHILAHAPTVQSSSETTSSFDAPLVSVKAQFASTVFEKKLNTGDLDWAKKSHVDGQKLLKQWEDGGVSAQQAIELINVLMLTQSPIIATTQQALDFAEQQAQATKNVFDVKNERNAMFFLRATDTLELVRKNLLSEVQLMTLDEMDQPSWQDVYAYWNKFSSDRMDDPALQNDKTYSSQEFDEARTQLLNAVENAGLGSLRVPLANWDSPQRITRLAHRIDQANSQLQQLTGWEGKVLGMDNALHLEIMKPGASCVTYQTKHGSINISSSWEDLAHEWLHGMQAVVAQRSVGSEALTNAFNTQHGQQPQLEKQWGDVLNQIVHHPSSASWQKNLNLYLNGSPLVNPSRTIHWDDMNAARSYYTSASETMAYAWGSYVQSQLPMNSALFPQSKDYNVADGVIAPTSLDAAVQKGTWDAAFKQLSALRPPTASVVLSNQKFRERVAAHRQALNKNTLGIANISIFKKDY